KYSKIFYDYWWTHKAFWKAMLERLKLEKDVMILVTGDTGSGKSHFVGNLCFKQAENEPNFILDEEFAKNYKELYRRYLKTKKEWRKETKSENPNQDKIDELNKKVISLRAEVKKARKENKDKFMFIPQENFIISPEEFAYKMITKEGQVLWGDEFRDGANRRDWYSLINKAILDRKNKNRILFNIYILCMRFEIEIDPKLAGLIQGWVRVRRGVGEVYIKRSGIKGGKGLDIKESLDREETWLKENPKKA